MEETVKALLAKAWKDKETNLPPGKHFIDEEFVVRVSGRVEKHDDQMVTPTVAVPLISVLALFWEKCGIARNEAMELLREAIIEALDEGLSKDSRIKSRIEDVNSAINAVRNNLLADLPKMPRTGRTITKELRVAVTPLKSVQAAG